MDQTTKQMHLSLHIGCRIIDALNGSMLANSMLGKGTVFKIVLPCKFP
jgi:signal transduction histidine kinase